MLKIKNFSISFLLDKKFTEVIHNISFSLNENEILGMVGESGSGKSITSLAVLGLLPKEIAKTSGTILFNEDDLNSYSERQFQKIRGKKIAMIFQEPMSCLNPTLSCGYQVEEILQQHTRLSKSEAKEEVISLFKKVKRKMDRILLFSILNKITIVSLTYFQKIALKDLNFQKLRF